jgi:hypothetical protein
VLFGDLGGTVYAFDTLSGKSLWSTNLEGAIAGRVVTYDTGAGQKIAVGRDDVTDLADAEGDRQGHHSRSQRSLSSLIRSEALPRSEK